MADKCAEVAGLNVERAIGIQMRPPLAKPDLNPSFTSRRLGNFEKSKDRSKSLPPAGLEDGIIVGTLNSGTGWARKKIGIYHEK